MSFTAQNIMDSVANRAHKVINTQGSDDELEVREWVKQAILYLQGVEDWRSHKDDFSITTSTTPALVAETYKYAMRTLLTLFRKLQGDSVRYARIFLAWKETPEDIDRALGPNWKDADQSGVPRCVTMMKNNLILAPKPSQSWIDAQGAAGLHGYCYLGDDVFTTTEGSEWWDQTLLFDQDLYMPLVNVSLIFATQTDDDSNFQTLLQNWEQNELTRLRGYDDVPMSEEQLKAPGWARRRRS